MLNSSSFCLGSTCKMFGLLHVVAITVVSHKLEHSDSSEITTNVSLVAIAVNTIT